MMNVRVTSVVAGLLVVSGCFVRPPNPNGNNSTSSSSSSSSSSTAGGPTSSVQGSSTGGNSSAGGSSQMTTSGGGSSHGASSGGSTSSSSGTTTSGGPTTLCERFTLGYARAVTSFIAARDLNTGLLDCAPAFANNEDAVLFAVGDISDVNAALCADGGSMAALVRDIAQAQQAGRLDFDLMAADQCTAQGRALFGANGLAATDTLAFDAGPGFVTTCNDAVVGLQMEGEPCLTDIECAQGTNGATCELRQGSSCEGVCHAKHTAGQACSGAVECADDLRCTNHVCEAPRPMGASCVSDAGQTLPCDDGLTCAGGTCVSRQPSGGTCTSDGDCQDGLRCDNRMCAPLVGEGGDCTGSSIISAVCQPCLACFTHSAAAGQDAGPPTCETYASVGQACTDRPCHRGLACSSGMCIALARHGQPCVSVDGNDDAVRGNCLSASDTCIGTPRVCTTRADEGEACVSQTGSLAVTGSCRTTALSSEGTLVCARTRATDSSGVCKAAAAPGEACGYVQNLSSRCVGPAGANVGCTQYSDGGVGTCVYTGGGPEGAPCSASYACEDGLYCSIPGDAGVGTCARGGVLNASCGPGEPWDDVCLEGSCRLAPDAGNVMRCLGYRAMNDVCDPGSGQCGPLLRCVNVDGGRGGLGRCIDRLPVGSTCSNAADECAAGSSCNDGVCVNDVCASREGSTCADGGGIPLLLLFGAVFIRRRAKG